MKRFFRSAVIGVVLLAGVVLVPLVFQARTSSVAAAGNEAAAAVQPVAADMGLTVAGVELVAQVTGADSANDTAGRWGVHGTDLGHMFWHRERLYMVFGDTFGAGGFGGRNWRSNALARLAEPDPARGLVIDTMITDADGMARELLPSWKIGGLEKTVIPTYGISVDGRMYLHYMSVRSWGEHGHWKVRRSGFAYSDEDGESWHLPRSALWPANTGFEQVALVAHRGHVFNLGIPQGRWGDVRLRRVLPEAMLQREAYEYWDGQAWVPSPEAAAVVVPGPVGELSVIWSEPHQQWLMMYLNPRREAVVLRTAAALTGPWGGEQVVASAAQYPGLYAPYIVPVAGQPDEVYFTMSLWERYNVVLMRMGLNPAPETVAADAGTGSSS